MSRTPPKPGTQLLESFCSTSRLIKDSAKSPTIPLRHTATPNNAHPHHSVAFASEFIAGTSQRKVVADAPTEKTTAPIAPSTVLPGLSPGAILLRPNSRPTVYAPISPIFVTITTDAVVKIGDLVVVKGVLNLDRDFGMGYKYEILVEDAEIKVE